MQIGEFNAKLQIANKLFAYSQHSHISFVDLHRVE